MNAECTPPSPPFYPPPSLQGSASTRSSVEYSRPILLGQSRFKVTVTAGARPPLPVHGWGREAPDSESFQKGGLSHPLIGRFLPLSRLQFLFACGGVPRLTPPPTVLLTPRRAWTYSLRATTCPS